MPGHKDKLHLGIIGCGRAATYWHLPALQRLKEYQLIAAADSDGAKLQHVANRYHIPQRYSDYRRLIDNNDVDIVAVLTPTRCHAEMTVAALRSGRHVLIDKPLALTPAECDQMIKEAALSSAKIMVGFNMRWHRLIRRARNVIQSGRLGEIKAVRSAYTHWHPGETAQEWHKKNAEGGGVLFNDGVHHFDLWRYLIGSDVVELSALNRPSKHFENETTVLSARLANGALASAVMSFATSPNSELEIYGEEGRFYISCYRFDGLEYYSHSVYPGDIKDRLHKLVNTLSAVPWALSAVVRGGDFDMTYINQWRHFAECIVRDKPPEGSLEDGKRAVEIACAALAGMESGRTVTLKESES